MDKSNLHVAIAGLGTIGSGVATLLLDHAQAKAPVKLSKILEKNPHGPYAQPIYDQHADLFTDDWEQVVRDPAIDVIVETIGGRNFSKTLIQEALKHGKHVVTANKDLIATHGAELLSLADEAKTHLLFEASVGGAIPVIRLLQDYFSLSDVQEVMGILNGTTNYILSEMDANNIAFDQALKDAQIKGFAEPDPTNDIKGYDARYKIAILTYLITQTWLSPDAITVEGIDHLDLPDFEYAARMNRKIKLVAYLKRDGHHLQVFVLPVMLPQSHSVSKVGGSTNIVTVVGKYSEEISLIGQGAGTRPTASAIVSDIYKILEHPKPKPLPVSNTSNELVPFSEYRFKHTLSFTVTDQPGIVGTIGTILAKHQINIYALEQLPQYHHQGQQEGTIIFTLTLEACVEGTVQKALSEINAAAFMVKPVSVLRELCEA